MAGPVHDIAYDGSSIYVRVGLSGSIQTSPDAVTWTTRTSGVSVALWGAAYGNGVFVVCGASGTVLNSSDGITWVNHSAGVPSPASSEDLYSVSFADVFIACGTSGTIIASNALGTAWGAIVSGTSEDLWDIDAAGGLWEAVGDEDVVVTGTLESTELSATLVDELTQADTNTSAGSTLFSTVTDGWQHRKRASHDTEALTHWRDVSDNFLLNANQSDNATLNRTASETINLLKRVFINNEVLTDGFTLAPSAVVSWLFVLQDDFTLSDVDPTYKLTAKPTITDDFTLDDTLAGALQISVTLVDGTGIGETPTGNMTFASTIAESIAFQALISVSGTETQDSELWTTWVLNTGNLAVSEYERYDFHSFAKYNNTYYGAKDDGVYSLTGDYDDGWLIKAAIKTGILDFKSAFQKKMPRMYLGLRNDDTMVLKTITNEGVERWYQMKDNQTGIAKSRVTGTQGVKSAYWQFELVNVTGGDFDISDIQLMPILTSRRIK